LLIAFAVLPTHAADRYVRSGATGNGSGTDWANAYPGLPNTLIRGDTYWLADGSYGAYTFDDPPSGTSVITIRKATTANHGTSTGWSDSYGDGQAVFAGMTFAYGYYVIDGVRRNEGNWADTTAYGIRVTGSLYSSRLASSSNACADNLTFRYVDVGGPPGTGASSSAGEGLYLGGFGDGSLACENWTLHRSHVHNVKVHIQCAGCRGLLVEYTYFGPGWGKEAIRGQVAASDIVIRHNIFKDSCQRDPADSTSGCTGEIAMWSGSNHDNVEIYGNVFYKTTGEVNSGGVIVIGGDGSSWVGPPANNTKIYNNTIAGLKSWNAKILVNGGSGNVCRNNLWFDNTGSSTGCTASTTSNNIVASSNPFSNYAAGDFRLAAATAAGFPLTSPYNTDLRGAQRGGDGSWDVGAYEFGVGGTQPAPTGGGTQSPPPPTTAVLPAPTNLRVTP
jgi:hypothetical protein